MCREASASCSSKAAQRLRAAQAGKAAAPLRVRHGLLLCCSTFFHYCVRLCESCTLSSMKCAGPNAGCITAAPRPHPIMDASPLRTCLGTLGVWPRTLPARAKLPWTLPARAGQQQARQVRAKSGRGH